MAGRQAELNRRSGQIDADLFSARSGVTPCQRRHAYREDQNSSLEDRLKVRGRSENGEAVEPDSVPSTFLRIAKPRSNIALLIVISSSS